MKQKLPLWFKLTYLFSFVLAFHFFLPTFVREKVFGNAIVEKKVSYNSIPREVKHDVIETFVGTMTGYGPDCIGCGGHTGCDPNQDVRNGNIYYQDDYYGKLRIVASDRKYTCGTVLRITASNVYDKPFYAIVLDRGGVIKGNKFDLLFASEKDALPVGFQRDVKYEILRKGW